MENIRTKRKGAHLLATYLLHFPYESIFVWVYLKTVSVYNETYSIRVRHYFEYMSLCCFRL